MNYDGSTLIIHLGYLSYEEESSTVYIPNQEIRIEFENAIEGSHWNVSGTKSAHFM